MTVTMQSLGNPSAPVSRSPSKWALAIALRLLPIALAFGLAACTEVEFYERQHLASALMQFESSPALDDLMQKVFYSREATTGGIGAGAGGGCGCSN
jgi:hypothetical protein